MDLFLPILALDGLAAPVETGGLTGNPALDALLSSGGTLGIMAFAVWALARNTARQYGERIAALETRSDECERDRMELHKQLLNLALQVSSNGPKGMPISPD